MLAPQGVVVRASDVVVFDDFALLVDARDGHEGCPRASGFGIPDRGLFYLDRGCCPAPDFRRTRTSPARFPYFFQAQPFDAGTLRSLSIESFPISLLSKLVDRCNYEHASHSQVNGRRFERRAKRHSLKGLLACVEACSHIQTPISDVGSSRGVGKHCCRITRGRAFLWVLWCGDAPREDSSLTRRVSISLPGLRPLHRPAWPRSSAGLPRHPRLTNHGLPYPYHRADFRDPTRFRETSASARDRVLSFPLWSQGSTLCEDVQRQTLGGAPPPRVLLG